MIRFLYIVNQCLRTEGVFAVDASLAGRLRSVLAILISCGMFYGMVMGAYSGLALGRFHQMLYSAVKVPLLLLATFALCLPSFFVINTLAGLRDDFARVVHALLTAQACVTALLAGLAPITAFLYLSCTTYQGAILINAVMFAIASLSTQVVLRRYYQPLIRHAPRHQHLLVAWIVLYGFVGIQMGWVLRPFIGSPNTAVAFFRSDAWGNAYIVVLQLLMNVMRGA